MDDDHTNLYNMMFEHPNIYIYILLSNLYFLTSIVYSFHPIIGNIVQIKEIKIDTQPIIKHLTT